MYTGRFNIPKGKVSMKNARIKLVGTRPILFHKFNFEIIQEMSKVKSGSAGNNPEEWRETFFEENDQLYLPSSYWFACFKAGAVYTKVGRGTLQKTITAALIVEDEKCFLNRKMPPNWQSIPTIEFPRDPLGDVFLDIRGVVNPNSKGKNVRYRIGCGKGWETEFHISWDDTVVSTPQVKKVIEDSGKMIGQADGRTLGYGRFALNSFEIIE